jgi:cytosine/uracil/thiamine/allantoin permease
LNCDDLYRRGGAYEYRAAIGSTLAGIAVALIGLVVPVLAWLPWSASSR